MFYVNNPGSDPLLQSVKMLHLHGLPHQSVQILWEHLPFQVFHTEYHCEILEPVYLMFHEAGEMEASPL